MVVERHVCMPFQPTIVCAWGRYRFYFTLQYKPYYSPLSSAFRVSCSWRHVLCCAVLCTTLNIPLHTPLQYCSVQFRSLLLYFSPSCTHSIPFIHSVSARIWFFALTLFFPSLFWYVYFVMFSVFFGVHWHCVRASYTRVK